MNRSFISLIALAIFSAGCSGGFESINLGSNGNDSLTAVQILSPDADTESQGQIQLQGKCDNAAAVLIFADDPTDPIEQLSCSNGQFTGAVQLRGLDGLKSLSVKQSIHGFDFTDSRDFVKDTIAPLNDVVGPEEAQEVQDMVGVFGLCEDGIMVEVDGAGVSNPHQTDCVGGEFSTTVDLTDGDGDKQISVSQKDKAGNKGGKGRGVKKDTTPPVLTAAPADGTVGMMGLTLTGQCEPRLDVEAAGAGLLASVTQSCDNAGSYTIDILFSAGDGNKVLTISSTDKAGNSTLVARTYVRDMTNPTVKIANPAANSFIAQTFQIDGTCESGINVLLSGDLAQNVTTTCANSQFAAQVTASNGDGAKAVTATQTDAVGNSASDSRSFILDTSAPAVSIAQPANNSFIGDQFVLSGSCESGIDVKVEGTAPAQMGVAPCLNSSYATTITTSAGDGAKTLKVSQTDAAGNTGDQTINLTKDTVAPVIAINAPADGATVTSAQINLQGTCETGIDVNVSGDVASNVQGACSNGQFNIAVVLSALNGNKTVDADQTDAAGNKGSDTRTFILNAGGPIVAIQNPVSNTVAKDGLTMSGTCQSGLNVELSGTGINTVTNTACANGAFSQAILFSAGDGPKNIVAKQTDAAGQTGMDSRTFVRDTTAPNITIAQPAAGTATKDNIALSGTCEDGLTVTIAGTGAAASQNVVCTNSMFSASVALSAGDGNKSLTASQTDAIGNSATDSRNFVLDTTAPNLTIVQPAAGTIGKDGLTVSGTCESGLGVTVSGSGVASNVSGNCQNSSYSIAFLFSSGDGNKSVTVSQMDALGNSTQMNRSFVRDATAPGITIAQPAAGTPAQTGVTLQGACDSGLAIVLSGAGLASPNSATCSNSSYSVAITFTNGDGSKNIIASQTDAAGNIGNASRSFVKDTTAPVVAILQPAADTIAMNGLTVTGSCEIGVDVVLFGPGVAQNVNASCANGTFSGAITFTAGDGTKEVRAGQTDLAGNFATSIRNYIKDATAPILSFSSPAAGTQAEQGLTIIGSCEAGLTVSIAGVGVNMPSTTACSNGAFTTDITFSNGLGNKDVSVSQTDAAGNAGSAMRTFERIAPPVDGPALYAAHCAGCHLNLANSTKRNRTAVQIQDAIDQIGVMKFLNTLTPVEVQAIADALNDDGNPPPPPMQATLNYVASIGNRYHIQSKMMQTFYDEIAPNSTDNNISNRIRDYTFRQPANLGGPCSRYDRLDDADTQTCYGGGNRGSGHDANIKALPSPNTSAVRKGYTNRTCENVLVYDKAVTNALGKVGLTTASAANDANMSLLFDLFYPGKLPDQEILDALNALYADGAANGFNNTQKWRFVLMAPCVSSLGDML